jgi:O-antigen/teichoic acid export membrane protein
VARTQASFFAARERGGPPSLANAIQRICSAALGIGALQAGYGVVAVGATYSAGSLIGVVLGFVLLHRTIGVPARVVSYRKWRAMAVGSVPFAAQDVFTVLLGRVDILILSLIASQASVGRYGGAYRLFESTLFITYALTGAFAAMYTNLDHDSNPTLGSVYQRSIKLALVSLMPVAVVFAVLAGPICRLIYGATFASAAVPLRILAFGVPLISIVTLTTSLMVSRENPRRMVSLTALMAGINIVFNLVLIPRYSDRGAAAAMLATEVLYTGWIMRMASRTVGGVQWTQTVAGALTAGGGMILVTLMLDSSPWAALALGGAVYLVILIIVERLVSPGDVKFAVDMVRRRLPARLTGPSNP